MGSVIQDLKRSCFWDIRKRKWVLESVLDFIFNCVWNDLFQITIKISLIIFLLMYMQGLLNQKSWQFGQFDKPLYKRKEIQNDISVFIFIYALQNLMKLVHHLLDIKLVLGRLHVLSHLFITMQQSKIEEILASLNFFCVLMGQWRRALMNKSFLQYCIQNFSVVLKTF